MVELFQMRLTSYQVCQIPLLYSGHYEYNENWLSKLHPLGIVTIKKEKELHNKNSVFFCVSLLQVFIENMAGFVVSVIQ